MIQFIPGMTHPTPASGQFWLVVWQGHLLTRARSYRFTAAQLDEITAGLPGLEVAGRHKVGQLGGDDIFLAWLSGSPAPSLFERDAPDDLRLVGLRSFLTTVSEAEFAALGAACQLAAWDADYRYCGRCAGITEMLDDDRCRYCKRCNHRYYPRVSPCVIMLVTRGDECLLAVHQRSQVPIYTALAGFIEPGESLETAVLREVEEEVGLRVQKPSYVASQPWPFPGQLMMGFHAEFEGGELCLQDQEITRAEWFHYGALPELIPPEQTLSGQLIRAFVASRSAQESAGR